MANHQPVLQALALHRNLERLGLQQRRLGLNPLRTQLLILVWRMPQAPLQSLCQRYYLDAKAVSQALGRLSQQGYILCHRADSGRARLLRRWRPSARAKAIVPTLLRAESRLHRALSSLGPSFSSHWRYGMQSLNDAISRQLKQDKAGEQD